MVARIVFEGTRATGVEYRQHGMLWRAGAARQVVLCGGTIGSAHVLQLSGVGVADDIRAVGIDVVKHLPGVGRNLQDHAQLPVTFGCSKPLTMHQMIRVDRAAWHMLRAVVTGEGPFAQFPTQAGGFTRSRPDLAAPDIQWHFGNFLGVDRVRVPYPGRKPGPLERDGFLFSMCQLRPESRGDIRIVSPDPEANPAIRPNYLSAPRDLEVMIFAVKEARRVAGQKALSPYLDGEIAPGAAVRSDDEIAGWVRSALGTVHHQVGTCKMGSDPMAVVDDTLAVHGLQGLTVADASIMPTLVGGNTHAPVIMIAEKAADFVKARAG